ncbi:reverse transcriptase [Vairimorpha necatrix]|uniref:Reverse transcriptase n=1 Tax=Vairimorpha necatrix TaxID=6039 RepID=A0AAX4JGR4_9MICR
MIYKTNKYLNADASSERSVMVDYYWSAKSYFFLLLKWLYEKRVHIENKHFYAEFTRTIEGTETTIREHIQKIYNIKTELSLRNLNDFETLSSYNKWNGSQAGQIYHSLIYDSMYKEKLAKNSYIALRKQLLDILYPKTKYRILSNKIDKIKQTDYKTINEYMEKILQELEGYIHVNELTRKEVERKQEEIFFKGLGAHTTIKITDQRLKTASFEEVINFLSELEETIIAQLTDAKQYCATTISDSKVKKTFSNKKWCKYHQSKFHNTKDCSLHRNDKEPKNNLLISELKTITQDGIKIQGKLNSKKLQFFIDTGATYNYIHKKLLKELDLKPIEAKPVTMIFGSGTKETTSLSVETKLALDEKEFFVKFYVLERIPEDLIIGYEFLVANNAILNINKRMLVLENNKKIPFIDAEKSTKESLDEILYETTLYERISTDIFGPFKYYEQKDNSTPEEKTGYILTISDIFSRETKLFFFKSFKTRQIIESIIYWTKIKEQPKHVISDNGRQYTSSALKNYFEEVGINHILIPTYAPKSNGISERINQTIAFILSINKNQTYSTSHKGNTVYKRNLTASKLDRKYGPKRLIEEVGSKGNWVRLKGDKTWTHIRNLKF